MPIGRIEDFLDVPIGRVREFWDARPCNIRHSRRDVGSREYFDEVEERKYFVEPHIHTFAQFEKWRDKKVLEVGCGIGTDTVNFARAGAKVTAVDFSPKSLDIAKRRAEVYGLEIDFYEASAEKLSDIVPVEEYDLIYSFGVLHHTPRPARAISEMRKYMGPDSLLKIMVYHRHSWKVLWILTTYGKGAFWKSRDLIARHSEAQTGCPVTYSFTKKTIRRLLAGFIIQDVTIDHIFPYKIREYRNHEYVREWYFRYLPRRLFHWMEKRWGWHLCVTARI
ncbi:MAG: methyltransferase domain-containing protein [Phycisphaerales bacterium]|nr:MAG: methyltransferase domain-containing protein [Phycisphaerales bacterium]